MMSGVAEIIHPQLALSYDDRARRVHVSQPHYITPDVDRMTFGVICAQIKGYHLKNLPN